MAPFDKGQAPLATPSLAYKQPLEIIHFSCIAMYLVLLEWVTEDYKYVGIRIRNGNLNTGVNVDVDTSEVMNS